MTNGITVMSGELGNIFWDLPSWTVYVPGFDLGFTIYVANPTDTGKEYTLMARLSSNETVISEEAIKVFGHAWFRVDPGDFVRLRGALRFAESDVILSVLLVERETEAVTDSVSMSLVAPTAAALPPSWPGMPGAPGEGFDWSTMLMMLLPFMVLGVVASAARPRKGEKVILPPGEERKLLPSGRDG